MLTALLFACSPPPQPDVLLVTLDTTRADALGAYGNTQAHTPTIDALARRGLLVREASTVAPLTLPAHASLLTGLTPAAHGIRDNSGYRLDTGIPTVAERFRAAGWQTGAIVAAAVLDGNTGIDRGFDTYEDGFDATATALSLEVPQHGGAFVRARAQEWLLSLSAERPFFGWVHFYDAHEPLTPPEPWRATVPDPYLAEIAFVDDQLRILLDQVRVLERERPLIVAVVADHGEDRGDHGEQTHGIFLYRSTTRIPMILQADGLPIGVDEGPRSIVDIAPTLLSLAQLPPLENIDGRSLTEPATGEAYAESWTPRLQFGFSELRSVQDARYRYIRAPRPELYDWRADPEERHDLAAREPAIVAEMSARMDARLAAAAAPTKATGTLLQSLESLGYIAPLADVPEDAPYTTLPDPKEAPRMALDFSATVTRARSVPPAEGVPLLEAYLLAHPRVGGIRPVLARGYTLLKRYEDARSTLAPLVAAHPDDVMLGLLLANIHLEEGAPDRARGVADELRRRHPESARAWAMAAEARRRSGDCAGAIQIADDGLALHGEASLLRLVRGACRVVGAAGSGVPDLEAVLTSDPANPDVRYLLGAAYARDGRIEDAIRMYDAHLARDPGHIVASVAKGMVLANVGRLEEALPLLLPALDHPEVGAEPVDALIGVLERGHGDAALLRRARAVAATRAPAHRAEGSAGTAPPRER